MLYPRAEYGNRQAVAGSEEVALREPAACGGREIDRVALSQTCEGIVRDRGSALESVSKVALRPLDHAALNGLHVGKRRCLALLVVQQADQERAEDLHQIGLSARSPVDLMGYRVGNRIGREAGSRLRQQPGRRGQIEKGKLDLPLMKWSSQTPSSSSKGAAPETSRRTPRRCWMVARNRPINWRNSSRLPGKRSCSRSNSSMAMRTRRPLGSWSNFSSQIG